MCNQCFADTNWLTVMGDRLDPSVDTIEVNPTPVSNSGEHRVMQIRVNRSAPRTNWDGIWYRSYSATVDIDCVEKVAEFLQITYYVQPNWTGQPSETVSYTKTDPRVMRFRGVSPNPVERILRAACPKSVGG